MERPGGGGRSHRPDRREADIEYLKATGVRTVISIMSTRHNVTEYEAAGLEAIHVPVTEDYDGLVEAEKVLRRATRGRGAVAIHGNRYTDFVTAICARHLDFHNGTPPDEALDAAIAAGLMVTPRIAELLEVDPDWIEDVLLQEAA